jgi:hypothetical protein
MLLQTFFETLRQRGLKVGTQEWLALLDALSLGLHGSRMTGFYHVARSLLVKRESEYDLFDQVFAHVFKGAELAAAEISDEIEKWLSDPLRHLRLSPEELEALAKLDLEELRRQLEERLKEQTERHDGGSRWIGTGGTSPFGWGGSHPSGIRIGGESLGRSAMQVAAQRRYREYRTDLVLDVRQMKVALRRLRELTREGGDDELDLDASIDTTCRNAGELTLVFRPPRRNNVRLLLLMDVGGSMDPHSRLVSRLFTAANAARHLRSFAAYYFHNCVYEEVYEDAQFRKTLPVADLLNKYDRDTKLVVVGDALMHPVELFDVGGASDYYQHNFTPGIECLRRLADHFRRIAWLNPEPASYWRHPTTSAIGRLMPMFALTLDGLDAAVASLVKGPGRAGATAPPPR